MLNPAAMRASGSRDFTTSPISAPDVKAEAIVVSEIGAMLSPKAPPAMMPTASIVGSAPRATPVG